MHKYLHNSFKTIECIQKCRQGGVTVGDSHALRDGGRFELRRITWDGAAEKCERVYEDMVAGRKA